MSILTGQQIGGARINNSGGALAIGDVVVIDTTGNLWVKTTTISGDLNVCGVVVEGGANGDYVRVGSTDIVKINVDGATTRGQWLKASSTAKKATPVMAWGPSCFALALESIGAAGIIKAQLFLPPLQSEKPGALGSIAYAMVGHTHTLATAEVKALNLDADAILAVQVFS